MGLVIALTQFAEDDLSDAELPARPASGESGLETEPLQTGNFGLHSSGWAWVRLRIEAPAAGGATTRVPSITTNIYPDCLVIPFRWWGPPVGSFGAIGR